MEGKRNHNSSEQMAALCRKVAAQGAVLLKNEDAVLPLTADDRVAVFGRCQKEIGRAHV